jgi:hypothetical protein
MPTKPDSSGMSYPKSCLGFLLAIVFLGSNVVVHNEAYGVISFLILVAICVMALLMGKDL